MDENKIVIVSDENGVVAFDDITIKHDTVNRAEVAEVEAEIAKLENDKVAIDNRIVELKAKVLYAKKVIAIADEKLKADADAAAANVESVESATEANSTNDTVSEGEASILADVVGNDVTAENPEGN